MNYGKTQQEAQYRVNIKRFLRKAGIKGWNNNDSTYKLENIAKQIKKCDKKKPFGRKTTPMDFKY